MAPPDWRVALTMNISSHDGSWCFKLLLASHMVLKLPREVASGFLLADQAN
jgi:hypothetical protein